MNMILMNMIHVSHTFTVTQEKDRKCSTSTPNPAFPSIFKLGGHASWQRKTALSQV